MVVRSGGSDDGSQEVFETKGGRAQNGNDSQWEEVADDSNDNREPKEEDNERRDDWIYEARVLEYIVAYMCSMTSASITRSCRAHQRTQTMCKTCADGGNRRGVVRMVGMVGMVGTAKLESWGSLGCRQGRADCKTLWAGE